MSGRQTILLLEDEPIILMDLEFAAEDRGLDPIAVACPDAALRVLDDRGDTVNLAILDVSLGENRTCFPVARELERRGIPYILHSANLDRLNERFRLLDAHIVPKPAPSDMVVGAAIAHYEGAIDGGARRAAE